MTSIDILQHERQAALQASAQGAPAPTSNPFFGVGPITDGMSGETEARRSRFAFEHWLETSYRKRDDTGRDIGPFTVAEISRSMHRGTPADQFILDMMREIHGYFSFPKENRLAVGLGGGHSGFTVAALHMISGGDPAQQVFVDTPMPESNLAAAGGFFRQSWGAQLVELMRLSKTGDESRLHFSPDEGAIPSAQELTRRGIKLVFGVGHETTGATTYTAEEISNLLEWIDADPQNHHAVLDATSLLGAMPWGEELSNAVTAKCCFFMPFQKAIGGISGYFVMSFTPYALQLVEHNSKSPLSAIPRQMKLAVPVDQKKPLTGERSVGLGPFYDPLQDKMLGGVINTFSILAFAETTYGLKQAARRVGTVQDMNRRSTANRAAINSWLAGQNLLAAGVAEADRRGAAVTLLKINDPGITDPALHARIITRSKQLLSYEGITHPNGEHEEGLDVARYINAFPGTPGDYRAWIGGIRDEADIERLLENLSYAYQRAKIVVLEEELEKHGVTVPKAAKQLDARMDDAGRAYKVLIADLVGLAHDKKGVPDPSAVKSHIESSGAHFHKGTAKAGKPYPPGIHFFYAPGLATEAEILPLTAQGQYDAVIAAATFLPVGSHFPLGGVRMGAGTGNMQCACWGGANGIGGSAPLMNTPGFNSQATAQMAMKAILRVLPDIPVDDIHKRTLAGRFDTGTDLKDFPTAKISSKTLGLIGYGNIGRQLAKLAAAFGMRVKVHARPRHRAWIEQEGFVFAPHAEDAAEGADVLSIHIGLGVRDAQTGRFENQGFVGTGILSRLNPGAVLVNYDRGELIDVKALDKALKTGRVRHAAIDADIFRQKGKLSGPLAPYLPLARKYKGRLELLPHVAADTDHVTRVEAAKQAVDQIIACIRFKHLTNVKGSVPEGFTSLGVKSLPGITRLSQDEMHRIAADRQAVHKLRNTAEELAAIAAAWDTASQSRKRRVEVGRHSRAILTAANTLLVHLKALGLEGPLDEA